MRARDNPFATERVHAIRYRPLGTTFDEILARLDELNYRAAIVGPKGSGKTTLLEDLQQILERKGLQTKLLFVNNTSPFTDAACRRFLSELTPQELVLLDGADGIRRSLWLLFRRCTITRASGLIITSHRPGLLPTLIECTTTPSLLHEIATELIPPGQSLPSTLLDDLYTRHHGNLRACLRALYDLYAQADLV